MTTKQTGHTPGPWGLKAAVGWLALGVTKNTQKNLRAITILNNAIAKAEGETR